MDFIKANCTVKKMKEDYTFPLASIELIAASTEQPGLQFSTGEASPTNREWRILVILRYLF